ncbi:MAG TPA: hypothetical protein VEI52_08505 [Terriglobales bacterium]|nr:hypothetical protein [Terriglobales bacterium]
MPLGVTPGWNAGGWGGGSGGVGAATVVGTFGVGVDLSVDVGEG